MGVVIQDMDVISRKADDDAAPQPAPDAGEAQPHGMTARDIERVVEHREERYERVRAH
ncbi:MAG TPA: hypothetical protein VD968_10685 [Pyrinomonadaceae bacterium]|nr:hypothetical protein [Pyrinomonadaceae bacterium]